MNLTNLILSRWNKCRTLNNLHYYTLNIFTKQNLVISILIASLNTQLFVCFINFVYFCLIRSKSINLFQYILSRTDSNCLNKIDCFNKIYANVVVRKTYEFSASCYFRWHWCDTINSSTKVPPKRRYCLTRGRHIAGNNLNSWWRNNFFRF